MSLAAMLEEIAKEQELEAAFESERRAVLAEAQDSAALEEWRLWETTLEDGLDA